MTDEQALQVAQHNAHIENQQKMLAIISEMKEIPELPSEVPTDVHALTHVEMPETGGVLTYMEGYDEPYKGFPFHEFVDKIDTIKKLSRGVLSSLFHDVKKRNKLQVALLVLVPWLFNDLLKGTIYAFHRIIIRFKIKELRYCDAVREVYRAMSERFPEETVESVEIRERVRDLLCMVLENDNAYRFRFQDIIVELDKEALRKNPSKELVRLLSVMQTREKGQDVADTWTLLKTFLPMYLFVNTKVKKEIVRLLSGLDLEKVRLSKEDIYYCKPRKDYQFGFMEI